MMPTGMGKSPLCKFLRNHLVTKAHTNRGLDDTSPAWILDDQTFEKMGDSMAENHSKLLGFYDELSTFLTHLSIIAFEHLQCVDGTFTTAVGM